MSASQEQTLSGRGVRVYTAHRGWLGVVTGDVLVLTNAQAAHVAVHVT